MRAMGMWVIGTMGDKDVCGKNMGDGDEGDKDKGTGSMDGVDEGDRDKGGEDMGNRSKKMGTSHGHHAAMAAMLASLVFPDGLI